MCSPTAAAVKVFRRPRADLYGKTDDEVFPPKTAAEFKANDRRVLGDGVAIQVVEALEHEDGHLHYSLVSKFPIPGPDGKVALVGGIAIDITEQRQTQLGLAESEQRFRQLAENINDVFWMSDLQKSLVLYVSPAYEQVWGRTCQSLYEQPGSFLDGIHPKDREHVQIDSLDRQSRGESGDVEYRLVRPDGTVRWIRDRSFPVKDQAGRVYRMAGIAEDITEQKLVHESLRVSEQRFKTLAQHAPVGIFRTDAEGKCTFVNDRWCAMAGMSQNDARGQVWIEAVHPQDQERVILAWRAAANAGRDFTSEFRFQTPQGQVTWLSGSAAVLRGAAGEGIGYIGTVTDISERERAEEALKLADRRKDEFLAMLAHELRNPLAPIVNGLYLLRMPDVDRRSAERAQQIVERQVGHMSRIVDELLDVSRITRGKVTLKRGPVDLARLARTSVEDHRPAFEQAGVSLTLEVPTTAAWVEGDVTRLTQVLSNLLQNALKFTRRGDEVVVQAEAEAKHVLLRVWDTGVGIEPEMLPHLFDIFTQGDNSLARSKGGLGLGLALVKGLVELHGGEVSAASAGSGRGRVRRGHFPGKPPSAVESTLQAEVPCVARRLRVLVIEDQLDAAESLRMLLEVAGHETTVAHSGSAGVATAKAWGPDVVLCDIGLPGAMSGYDVARALRQDLATATTHMIALTGYGQTEDYRRSREAGFDAHLVKPADPNALRDLLSRSRPVD